MYLPKVSRNRKSGESIVESMVFGKAKLERAEALFEYNGNVRSIIHDIKYRGEWKMGRWIGRIAAKEFSDSGLFDEIDYIIPTPLHWKRKLSRGYNQSYWIAEGIKDITGIPVCSNLMKRHTGNISQTKLSHERRAENVKGIFKLKDTEDYSGKHFLLIDDVMTTGSTITEMANTLEAIPNIKMSILVIAYAGGDNYS